MAQKTESKAKSGFKTMLVNAGVTSARIDAGPGEDVLVPRGRICAADGSKLKGRKPNFSVAQDDSGATVTFSSPPSDDIQLRYKLEAVDEDDEA